MYSPYNSAYQYPYDSSAYSSYNSNYLYPSSSSAYTTPAYIYGYSAGTYSPYTAYSYPLGAGYYSIP
jgi:hypothetical protein